MHCRSCVWCAAGFLGWLDVGCGVVGHLSSKLWKITSITSWVQHFDQVKLGILEYGRKEAWWTSEALQELLWFRFQSSLLCTHFAGDIIFCQAVHSRLHSTQRLGGYPVSGTRYGGVRIECYPPPQLAPTVPQCRVGKRLACGTAGQQIHRYWLAVWLSGNTLASINVVALRQIRLVPGWMTVCGRVNHLGM